MVNGGEQVVDLQMMFGEWNVLLLLMDEVFECCDVLIEMSVQFGVDYLCVFCECGGKVVMMWVGNDYVIDIECVMFDKLLGFLFFGVLYDVVWMIFEFECLCLYYYQMGLCVLVMIVLYIWYLMLFDKVCVMFGVGLLFGYQFGKLCWCVMMFELNICMVKMSIILMFVIEEVYCVKFEFFEFVCVCNMIYLKEYLMFVYFVKSFDIVNYGIMMFESCYVVYEFMVVYGDVVVLYMWENVQNYLYYELLYGDYLLIYNLLFFGKVGYFYLDFDCQVGGCVLLQVFVEYDVNFDVYCEQLKYVFDLVSIYNFENVVVYMDVIVIFYCDV